MNNNNSFDAFGHVRLRLPRTIEAVLKWEAMVEELLRRADES